MEIIKFKTEGLAQLSYLIIDKETAAVIDPRREAKIYYDKAKEQGASIKYIFETHRNEDFVTGSRELQRHCDAQILHGEGLDFEFGRFVKDNENFILDEICFQVLCTPGHTPESISLALYPTRESEQALAVFTGDSLFVNDVGRTDFFPDKRNEYAEMLYDSLHQKILPLGDEVVLYPAHGAGSVCGGKIADREISTLGFEKKHNPMLQLSKDEFIKQKANETHQKPPYFKEMEKINLKGSDTALINYQHTKNISREDLKKDFNKFQIIDVRSSEAFLGCHIPGSLSIPQGMLSAYAGYFISYDQPIVLVTDTEQEEEQAKAALVNLGYDNILGALAGGISAWEVSGESLASVRMLDVNHIQNEKSSSTLLDIRKPNEWDEGIIKNARTIFLGDLLKNLNEFSKDEHLITYCGSGKRATIAASLLQAHDFKNVSVFMGSMQAYQNKKAS